MGYDTATVHGNNKLQKKQADIQQANKLHYM